MNNIDIDCEAFHENDLLQDIFIKNLLQVVNLQENDSEFENYDDDGTLIEGED